MASDRLDDTAGVAIPRGCSPGVDDCPHPAKPGDAGDERGILWG
jgi:hypothetical protein